MQRSMTRLVVLVALLVGCTSSTPDPAPTTASTTGPTAAPTDPATDPSTPPAGRVAVVVSPDPALSAAAAEIGMRRVGSGLLGDTELRVVTADDRSFVPDLMTFLATEGYDLVCAVGAGADRAVREVATDSPSTRFCAAPALPQDMPSNVLAIEVRVEELGYLAGVALAADGLDGPAGLVTAPTTWEARRLRAGLLAGLAGGGVDTPTVRVARGGDDGQALAEEVAGLIGQGGVGGVLSLAGELDAVVRDVLLDTPLPAAATPTGPDDGAASPGQTAAADPRFAGLVAGPPARPSEDGGELADLLLVLLELHLEEAVRVAVDRHVDGWDTTATSVGLAEEAFRVEVGSSARARAVATAVRDAAAAIREERIEVPSG